MRSRLTRRHRLLATRERGPHDGRAVGRHERGEASDVVVALEARELASALARVPGIVGVDIVLVREERREAGQRGLGDVRLAACVVRRGLVSWFAVVGGRGDLEAAGVGRRKCELHDLAPQLPPCGVARGIEVGAQGQARCEAGEATQLHARGFTFHVGRLLELWVAPQKATVGGDMVDLVLARIALGLGVAEHRAAGHGVLVRGRAPAAVTEVAAGIEDARPPRREAWRVAAATWRWPPVAAAGRSPRDSSATGHVEVAGLAVSQGARDDRRVGLELPHEDRCQRDEELNARSP